MSDVSSWPPPFVVRVSAKARCARLRALPGDGLEVVIPHGVDPAVAADIVEKHKDWVLSALKRVCGESTAGPQPLPQVVPLHGGVVRLPVTYGCRNASPPDEGVVIKVEQENRLAAAKELQTWARGYAARVLGQETASLAGKHGMTFSQLRFRRQKSRWGSCTASGALSLNTCLIFLPQELSRYVIMHELAHTRHCNHGSEFWKTLFAMEPNALALDKRLRSAWRFVPNWIWL